MSRATNPLSRISLRLLAFNLLLVFLPAAGVLFLGTYETQLLEAQERTMAQEGRLLAAAIESSGSLDADHARRILIQLGQRHLARLRVVDETGKVLADSAVLGPRREPDQAPSAAVDTRRPQRGLLYRIGSLPVRMIRELTYQPIPARPAIDEVPGALRGSEVHAALAGRYGAATRVIDDPTHTVILNIAIPIRLDIEVVGAVVVSQSTTRIMSTLYAVRLDVFKVFLASFGFAVLLSLIVATTIVRPLARLRHRAGEILDRRGRLTGGFEPSRRNDEIGDLERALSELTRRLEDHLKRTESFASDVSHEFKNPLASIRTATDMALEAEDPNERRRFLTMIQADVARMERLLTETREISRIDAILKAEDREIVDLGVILSGLVESFRLRTGSRGLKLEFSAPDRETRVFVSADRLSQVFENLLANAVSFSPPDGEVKVSLREVDGRAEIVVADQGPGIPAEHRGRVFSRFFSYRPHDGSEGDHTGLGLALVRAIAEGYGGEVSFRSGTAGGTEFIVRLPLAATS